MGEYQTGKIVKGIVKGIKPYGIFVQFDEYYTGLIHISEVSDSYVRNLHHYTEIGSTIYVKVIGIDSEHKHLKLSIKNIDYKNSPQKRRLKIIETKQGFKTLEQMLPHWIDENLKNIQNVKNEINSIDK